MGKINENFKYFAILLIVTFVNTSKSISYSDIAQSLVQLHDEPTEGLAKLNEVAERFADSHKSLEGVIDANHGMCERLVKMGESVKAGLAAAIKHAHGEIETLAYSIEANQHIIDINVGAQKAEVQKIKEAAAVVKKEAELEETVNVLNRLKNIARDELAGNTKINTEMGQYKVVNNHGVSFIQRVNLKQELHGLLSKTHTASKALISTLIMMAANDDGHYSDPKIVAKIIAVLDKIINANESKKNHLKTDFQRDSQMNQEIIQNSSDMIINLKEGSIKAEFAISLAHRETNMYNRDIQYFTEMDGRRENSRKFHANFCANQKHMMAIYQKRYAAVATKMNELKSELSQ